MRHERWWRRRQVRAGALAALLAISGLVILALVREQTGTEGFMVGLGLAILPVPLLLAAFCWLGRVAPAPRRNLIFAFAWGACAAALIAILANSFATQWIATATADPQSADTIGAMVIAPVVEESAKAAAVLLVFLFRRRTFTSVVDGVVTAGVTATGFAFTENILYLGNAYGTDTAGGAALRDMSLDSVTAATFFVRIVMSPFAHPLFTVLTGIGFGLAALAADRQRIRRFLFPLAGLLPAMGLHSLWNGSSAFGEWGFFTVYAVVMVPAFGLLTWLSVHARRHELRTVRAELPVYTDAGWIAPPEPYALSSMRARRIAREYAARTGGQAAARAVREYEEHATALALLRRRGRRGRAGGDFVGRERELLDALWQRRAVARPALAHAARTTARIPYGPPMIHGRPGTYAPYAPYAPHVLYAPHIPYAPHAPYTAPGRPVP
nr:PrsW family intramembrane metalloprotease [Streptomyces triticagri]